jgi:signal transduction histidine kinase
MQAELKTAPKKQDAKLAPKVALRTQVQEILSVMTAFSALLSRETEALRKADFKAVDALQADKKLFAKQYEAKITSLANYRQELPNLELSLREKLIKERLRFNQLLDENMKALDTAQNSTKRLINRILEAARMAVVEQKQTNYSSGGKAMSYKAASMSINIDHSL